MRARRGRKRRSMSGTSSQGKRHHSFLCRTKHVKVQGDVVHRTLQRNPLSARAHHSHVISCDEARLRPRFETFPSTGFVVAMHREREERMQSPNSRHEWSKRDKKLHTIERTFQFRFRKRCQLLHASGIFHRTWCYTHHSYTVHSPFQR